jgi:hypothetical protein
VQSLLPVLRATFDATKYIVGDGNPEQKLKPRREDGEWSAKGLEDTLRSNLFHAYFSMVLNVHSIVDSLTDWCESCPCHSGMATSRRFNKRRKLLFGQYYDRPCPMKGKRLVEIVQGRLLGFLEDIGSAAALNVLMSTQYVTADEMRRPSDLGNVADARTLCICVSM